MTYRRPDPRKRPGWRKRRWQRRGETGLVALLVSLMGFGMVGLYALIVAAPWIIVALVLHWLGAF